MNELLFTPMSFKSLIALAISFLTLSSCYTNFKELDREVHVRIIDNTSVSVQNNSNSNFSGYLNDAQYRENMMQGLRSDLQANKVIIDDNNPEFEVFVSQLTVVESTKTDSIVDAESPSNGMTFELTTLDFSASGTMRRISDGETFSWSADKSKSESTTTSRSAAQIATGENKSKNEYREKELDANEASDLATKVGERAGAMIIRDLIKAVNQK